jgi:hypothetical protein
MALLEDRTAVFIVRVWCERGDADSALSEWRGSVEHVQSGQRTFFRYLEAIIEFMKPYLENIGIDAQQRFWERISSVMSDGESAPKVFEIEVEPTAPLRKSPPSITARKRR